jgi:hypothetical protein
MAREVGVDVLAVESHRAKGRRVRAVNHRVMHPPDHALLRFGGFGPDPVDDAESFLFGDLGEVEHDVTAFG